MTLCATGPPFPLFCVCVVWLQQGWGCSELKPLALWPRWELESRAIYTHPAQRNFRLVFPTKWGGLERWSTGRKKNKKVEHRLASLKRKLKADFLSSGLRLCERVHVSLCLLCEPCQKYLQVHGFKKGSKCKKCKNRWVKKKTSHVWVFSGNIHSITRYYLSTQTDVSTQHVWSYLCVARSKGCRGQDFQMFPIIPQPWHDLPGHPTPSLTSQNQEVRSKAG